MGVVQWYTVIGGVGGGDTVVTICNNLEKALADAAQEGGSKLSQEKSLARAAANIETVLLKVFEKLNGAVQ